MREVWNVSPWPLVVHNDQPAIPAGQSGRFDDVIAKGLLKSPDWSETDPRAPRQKKSVVKPAPGKG